MSDDGEEGGIGTHSKRKMPVTYDVNCACAWDWVEILGRWKGWRGSKIADRYIDVNQLFQDAKVAAVLCV